MSLAPLARVTRAAQAGGANALDPLPTADLPGEVAPLVEAFNGLLGRLSAAFQAQRSFVADAAHELRTPLTALKLQLGLLRDAAPGPQQDESIARLRGGIDRAVHLVEQLLALARAEPGAAAADLPLDLAELARQAVADVQPLADKAGVAISLTAPDPLPRTGDPQALRGALRNLIDNAVKYGAQTVQVSALRGPRGAPLLRVDDDGPGIPLEARERVFDRFQRGENATVEGSGLGLAIVQAAARQQEAEVTLATSPAGGLRVEIAWAN
jgi:two-component system OmpR family sensor kinase/two-component system sensor histidine kinase QseC